MLKKNALYFLSRGNPPGAMAQTKYSWNSLIVKIEGSSVRAAVAGVGVKSLW